MSLAEIIATLQAQIVALQDLQSSQTQFSQADLDAAVKLAVDPLALQISDLQAQVAAFPAAQTKAVADALAGQSTSFVAVLKAIQDADDKAIQDAVAALKPVS